MKKCQVWCIAVVVGIAFFFPMGKVMADSGNSTQTIIQHLEFLGYQCTKLDQGIKATHSSKLGFVLVVLKDGLMAQSALAGIPSQSHPSQDGTNQKEIEKLSAVNILNKESTIARFFWADSGELVLRASILGTYDKGRFYTFMEAWEKDGQAIGKHYQALKPYLK